MDEKKNTETVESEMDTLSRIYAEAWEEGIFVREFSSTLAAAGSVSKVEELEKRLGREIEINKLTMVDCMNLDAVPGVGQTRVETCRNAIKAYKEYCQTK